MYVYVERRYLNVKTGSPGLCIAASVQTLEMCVSVYTPEHVIKFGDNEDKHVR